MSFLEKYIIVSKLDEVETLSFRAQDTVTGQPVLVHQLLPGQTSPHQPDLMSMVYQYLPGEGTPGTEHFLDSGQEEDRIFIVTSDVPGCVNLRGWLELIAAWQGGGKTPAMPSPGEPESTDGFLGVGSDNSLGGAPEPPESQHQPGEFTSMFNSTGAQSKPPVSPAP